MYTHTHTCSHAQEEEATRQGASARVTAQSVKRINDEHKGRMLKSSVECKTGNSAQERRSEEDKAEEKESETDIKPPAATPTEAT